MKIHSLSTLVLFALATPLWSQTANQTVRFRTSLGDIDVILLNSSAPATVANFLNYVNRGAFNNSLFHRSVAGFILQGGGFQWRNLQSVAIPQDAPVRNEYSVSNTRGTLAMAKLGSNPNSATNQWFFNLADNSSNLNNQNGGFTVFGRVANPAGLAVMDQLASVPVFNLGSGTAFEQFPLRDYRSGTVGDANVLLVTSIALLENRPAIAGNGVIAAGDFGGAAIATAGSFLEIYGTGLAGASRGWAGSDFTNGNAPTTLDGVTVTIADQPAFISYVSATQINAQVPASVPATGSVPVVVTYQGQSSLPVMLAVRPLAPTLLAPASLKVGDKQYVGALHSATNAFVAPEAPATPGETLVFYGIGFGPVTGGVPVAGQIAQGSTAVSTPVQFRIGNALAEVVYAGFAPNLVGLYQFNVVVPPTAQSGDQPLSLTVGGEPTTQNLVLAVRATN